ncbi:lipoxygenase family protein [Antrihabitans sp. YC2-6]|uniref:lipoxygenase family protein n=1 Tax=Antrihabitans sp. YC2-6 TaxID=2799498 RepID=UPI0018F67F43|nr:lipoxygenase family protein [Antrihabitans sp. YC2-6]MBJ8344363.1 hypothetical protein [Antrihabitans sp. YC2-6]
MQEKLNRRRLLQLSAMAPAVAGVASFAGGMPTAQAAPFEPPMPMLPKDDPMPVIRQATLAAAQAQYQWTEAHPFIVGVPFAVFPPIDALPTIEWLITGADALIELGMNLVSTIIPQINACATGTLADSKNQFNQLNVRLDSGRMRFRNLGGGKYNMVGERPGDAYVHHVDPQDAAEATLIQTELMDVFRQIQIVIGNLRENLAALLNTNQGIGNFGTQEGLAKYNAIWGTMPLPPVAENVHDDELFAYMRIGGFNTNVIERVNGSLPAKFPLTNAQFQEGLGNTSDTLDGAIADGRLFWIDFEELGKMAPERATYKLLAGETHNNAPMAVFVVPQGKKSLQAIAIQCGQDPAVAPMFVRPAPDDQSRHWGWQMAKTVVQTADFNHHEMLAHLGRAHLVSEAFAVSVHRAFAPAHPLSVLLVPHFEGDLFVNELAADVILPENLFADVIIGAPLNDVRETVGKDRLDWDFYERMPAADFARRGVDNPSVLDFPYRDDALLIWDVLHNWVDEYIRAYYHSDADVVGDVELTAFADEVITRGKVKGFRRLTTIEELVEAVTMITFTASAYHASVNYPQSHLMTYAPFASGFTATAAPTTTTGHSEADWIKMLPSVFVSLANFYFLNVLATIYYRPLGDYRTNVFPFPEAIYDPKVTGALARFRSALQGAENEINVRNMTRSQPYEYLLPSNIPTSTNI